LKEYKYDYHHIYIRAQNGSKVAIRAGGVR
jgi:hypothetical protein